MKIYHVAMRFLATTLVLLSYSTANAEPFSLISQGVTVSTAQEVPLPPSTTPVLGNEGPIPEPEDPKYTPPALNVGGADSPIPLGELVQLWVKPPDIIPDNLYSTAYTWTLLPNKNFVTWPDKTRILFGSGIQSTTFVAVVTASHVFVEKNAEGDFNDIIQRTVTKMVTVKIGDGTVIIPPPGGGGGGNGNGGGVIPPGITGLAKQSYDWTIAVNVASKKADAAKLAASFTAVAAQIQNGSLRDVSAILNATKESNDRAITTREQWLPWFTRMSEHLQKSFSNGSIKTLQQFNTAWLEIAKGLQTASQ